MDRPGPAATNSDKGGGFGMIDVTTARETGDAGAAVTAPALAAGAGGLAAAGGARLSTRSAVRDWGNAVFLAVATGLGASLLLGAAVIALSLGAG